jgi:hypothetical protein
MAAPGNLIVTIRRSHIMAEETTGMGKFLGFVGIVTGLVVGWNATQNFWAAVIAAAICYFVGVSLGNTLQKVIAVALAILAILVSSYIRQAIVGPLIRGTLSPSQTRSVQPGPGYRSSPRASTAAVPAETGRAEGCHLYNDKSTEVTVNVRRSCDVDDCDADASTIIGTLPDNTPVRLVGAPVHSKVRPFAWTKVEVIDTGETVWVADSKIRCGRT